METGLAQGVVTLEFPYLTNLKPFIVVYDANGFRFVSGGNVVKALVTGNDYVIIKGYFSGLRPYVYDVVIGGDGARYLPSLINSLFNRYLGTGSGDVTLYLLQFKLPRDVDVSVRLHRLFRRCFYRVDKSWVGYRVCFDVDKVNEELRRYPGSYVRVYPVSMDRKEALSVVDSVIKALSDKIEYLRKDLMYELRSYRKARLTRLIDELNAVLNGWLEFRRTLG